jgi:hypothetical protein
MAITKGGEGKRWGGNGMREKLGGHNACSQYMVLGRLVLVWVVGVVNLLRRRQGTKINQNKP